MANHPGVNNFPLNPEKKPVRETARALGIYNEYAAMGPQRSLAKMAERYAAQTPKTSYRTWLRKMQMWSSTHHWQDRVKVYDFERAEERRVRREAELERMDDEHARVAREGVLLAAQRIRDLMKTKRMGAMATVQLLKVASDLEREARGATDLEIEKTPTGQININVGVGTYPVMLPQKGSLDQPETVESTSVEGSVTIVEERKDDAENTHLS